MPSEKIYTEVLKFDDFHFGGEPSKSTKYAKRLKIQYFTVENYSKRKLHITQKSEIAQNVILK